MPEPLETLRAALAPRYVVERELAAGGMSRVFLAREPALQRLVALKVLREDLAALVSADRFRREIQLTASLQHPHIVPLLTAGEVPDLYGPGTLGPYYTMPFVEGESLRARLAREGRLATPAAVALLRDVAKALAYAHHRGVVHRDVKPENVLLSGESAQVTDFGIARALTASATAGDAAGRITTVGLVLGTPAYMAPEQGAGDPATDFRADLYSFGVMAYETLAGELPFPATTMAALAAAHATTPAPPLRSRRPEVPVALAELVARCLAKAPEERPPSADAIVAALDALPSAGRQVAAGATGAARRATAAMAVAAVLAAVGGGWVALHRGSPRSVRLAVLPFEEIGCPEPQRVAEGLTEELTTRLVRVEGLAVIARTSALRYRASGKTAQEFGRDIGAEYVLDGTARCADASGAARLRVTPALMRVRDAQQTWGEPYEASLANTDLFDLQADLAERVASALQGRLLPAQRAAVRRANTGDLSAYDRYVVGRWYFRQRGPVPLRQAIRSFSEAVAHDPRYAAAWAGLAAAYSVTPVWGVAGITPRAALDSAELAAKRALALDSSSAEAHAALGEAIYYRDWDWNGAGRAFSRAVALDPSNAQAHAWLADLHLIQGRYPEALAEGRRAVALDPLNAHFRGLLGSYHFYLGALDSAAAQLDQAIALDSGAVRRLWQDTRIRVLLARHDTAGALAALGDAGVSPAVVAEATCAISGCPPAETLARVAAQLRDGEPQPFDVIGLAAAGRADSAMALLRRIVRESWRFKDIGLLLRDPLITQPLGSRADFRALRAEAGLQP